MHNALRSNTTIARTAGLRAWWVRCRRWGLPPRRVVTWSVISAGPMAVVIALGAYLSYHGHGLLVESRMRVDHTYQVLGVLNKLFISLEDAETGQRGFIITGEESYLAPYAAAVGQMDGNLDVLRGLLSSSSPQAERVARLDGLVEAKLRELGSVIALRRRSGFESASNAILQGEGKRLMDAVRQDIGAIVQAEETQLQARQDDARRRERELLHVGIVVAGLSIVLRIGLALVLSRLRARRSAATG